MSGPVFLFPGQGAQKAGMGRELAQAYGERFTPPASLVALAEAEGRYE